MSTIPSYKVMTGNLTRREWLRFLQKIAIGNPCACSPGKPHNHWIWKGGHIGDGYGSFHWRGDIYYAHRFIFMALQGSTPTSLQTDHLCRIHDCVNPQCLEMVPPRTNYLRGDSPPAENARKTHCKEGHPYDESNTRHNGDGSRRCRICATLWSKKHQKPQTHNCHSPGYSQGRNARLLAEGFCPRHRTARLVPGKKSCETCLAYWQERWRNRP
jgi:hypothetical protein